MPLLFACASGDIGRDEADQVAEGHHLVLEGTAPAAPSGAALPAGAGTRGEWPLATGDAANSRWSALDEIAAANVSRLQVAWTFSDGRRHGHEGTPLVVGATMYVVSPFPNVLTALDLSQPGAPAKWTYRPPALEAARGVACCDLVNRGAAYADGRVYFATLDNQVAAVDAATGREAWRVRVGEINRGETMTMAPLVVKGKVIVGNSGGEFGVRGWVTALDAVTGKIAWRAYGTGPDAEVLIDSATFRPFYAKDRGRDLGLRTWGPGQWAQGGATAWGWFSYDPELDLLYYGTGNAGPWNPELRPGDNKWSATIFARDPDDGRARWAYQVDPHNEQDYDAINESVLLDVTVGGPGSPVRKALLRAERNGWMYLMDRATGEVIAADTFAFTNTVLAVDTRTGVARKNPEKAIRTGKVVRHVCPSVQASKNYAPSAFSPQTGLAYVPANNFCMNVEGMEANYIAGTPYLGTTQVTMPGPGGFRGQLFAWDPVRRRKVWAVAERFPLWGGVLATAGGVVFYGTMDRWFKAVDARTGRLLWRFRTASGIVAPPMTYRGPDGRQYVAVWDGVGGWAGSIVSADLTTTDSAAGDGMVGAMNDLPQYTEKGGTLYVFALP